MESWTPLHVFWYSYAAAAMAGIGVLLHSDTNITARSIAATILMYGAVGSTLGSAAYAYLDAVRKYPMLAVGCGSLVGVRAIPFSYVSDLFKRVFNVPNDPK